MSIPKTITKVFTKHDAIIKRIHFPLIKPIVAFPLTDGSDILFADVATIDIPYDIAGVEQGLEGVRFVHYERQNENL